MKNEIIALRKRGFKYDEISAQLNVSKMTIARVLKDAGLTSNLWTKERLQKLSELCEQGYPNDYIAKKLGITYSQVRSGKSRYGFKQELPKYKKEIIELSKFYNSTETANILKMNRRFVQAIRTANGVNYNSRYYMIQRAHKLKKSGMTHLEICKALNKKYQTVVDYLCTNINI